MTQPESNIVVQTEIPDLKLFRRGKVRDVYEYGDHLLMIATDRISAFDVVLPTPIPLEGRRPDAALALLVRDDARRRAEPRWSARTCRSFPPDLQRYRTELDRRSMLLLKADMFPVECVARGYLAGSGWKEYKESGAVCGTPLPPGLRECDRLPEPIFTPATKAETGHDINIPFEEMERRIGAGHAAALRDLTLEIYRRAAEYALPRGIIIADVKFEFGLHNGEIMLCDEVLTPDSSRFWMRSSYRPGRPQPSFDKQYVRDYLESIHFDKRPPGPELPEAVVRGTTEKYLEAYRLLTGAPLA